MKENGSDLKRGEMEVIEELKILRFLQVRNRMTAYLRCYGFFSNVDELFKLSSR